MKKMTDVELQILELIYTTKRMNILVRQSRQSSVV